MDRLQDFITTWPVGRIEWAEFIMLAMIVLFKIDRATTLYKRSRFFDRLGVSTICVDVMFVLVYLYAIARRVHPELSTVTALRVGVVILAALGIGWGWYEVRRASNKRIEGAMAGDVKPDDPPTGRIVFRQRNDDWERGA